MTTAHRETSAPAHASAEPAPRYAQTMTVRSTRDELMTRKMDVDEKLAALRIEIDEAKAIAYTEGKYLPPREMANLKRAFAGLQRESQRLQFALRGDRKQAHAAKDHKGALYLQEFFMAARRHLTKDQFNAINKDAESRLRASDAARTLLETPRDE